MTNTERVNAQLPREPDGVVDKFHFWLGDMFEDDNGDSDMDDDTEAAQRAFEFDRGDGGSGC